MKRWMQSKGQRRKGHSDGHQTHPCLSLSSSLSIEVNRAISMKWGGPLLTTALSRFLSRKEGWEFRRKSTEEGKVGGRQKLRAGFRKRH